MRARYALLVLCLVGGGLFVPCGFAHAHLGHYVVSAERYIKIDVAANDTRIVLSLALGPNQAQRVLAPADTNRDDNVSQEEANRYLRAWTDSLSQELALTVDNRVVELRFTESVLAPLGSTHPDALTVEAVAHVSLSAGEHLLALGDNMDLARFERTDVAFRTQAGVTLTASDMGRAPREVHNELFYGTGWNPPEGRYLSARVHIEDGHTASVSVYVFAAGALLVFGLVTFLALRGKRMWARAKQGTS